MDNPLQGILLGIGMAILGMICALMDLSLAFLFSAHVAFFPIVLVVWIVVLPRMNRSVLVLFGTMGYAIVFQMPVILVLFVIAIVASVDVLLTSVIQQMTLIRTMTLACASACSYWLALVLMPWTLHYMDVLFMQTTLGLAQIIQLMMLIISTVGAAIVLHPWFAHRYAKMVVYRV